MSDSPELEQQITDKLALLREMQGLASELGVDDLTPTQERRMAGILAGKTSSEIAAQEGVSKQAVAKSVAAPVVRRAVRELIGASNVLTMRDGVEEKTTLIELAINTLYGLLKAKKPVIFGASYAMEADNQTRLAAALKIIALYEGGPQPSQPAHEPSATVEESVVEETAMATRRVARRRHSVG